MDSFWDNSWEHIDPARIAEYINAFDMGEDDSSDLLWAALMFQPMQQRLHRP